MKTNNFSQTINYLEEERKKLWKEIVLLKDMVEKKASDYEKNAQQASKKTSEYRNRSQESKETIDTLLVAVRKTANDVQALKSEAADSSELIQNLAFESENKSSSIDGTIEKIGRFRRLADHFRDSCLIFRYRYSRSL